MAYSGLHRKEPIFFATCFHAQQCAEKYLKALLIFKSKRFPKTHDLLELTRLCELAGIVIPVEENALDRLTEYAVLKRYPSESPTLDEAREALETAKAVRSRLDQDGLGKIAARLAGNKLTEKLEEKLGDKVSPDLKDALKGLFNR